MGFDVTLAGNRGIPIEYCQETSAEWEGMGEDGQPFHYTAQWQGHRSSH